MSRWFVLLAAVSFSCTRPNPYFGLDDDDDDDDHDSGPDSVSGFTTDPLDPTTDPLAPSSTTGGPVDPGHATSTTTGALEPTTTAATTATTSTTTSLPDLGDTCDTVCGEPADPCIDGLTCTGELEWLRRSGDAAVQRAADAAVLSDGSVVVVGNFTGELGTAPDVITATTELLEGDGFIYRLGPDGQQIWIRQLGGPGLQWATAVAVLSDDRIALAGHFTGQLELGPHKIDGVGAGAAFVAILGADGVSSTVHVLGGDAVEAHAVAVGPDDEILVAGRYLGDILIAGDKTTSDGLDLFAVRLDPLLGPIWSYVPVAPDDQVAHAVAAAASGDILLAGELHGELHFGADPVIADNGDGFVACLDPDGAALWGLRIGGPGVDRARALAAAPDGSFIVAGVHSGGLDFGAGVLPDTAGLLGGYIAAHDFQGELLWAHSGFLLDADGPGVAVDLHGHIVASLPVGADLLDLGEGPLGGVSGALLVKFASDGALVWARHLEGQVTPFGHGLGLGPAGEIAVAGAFDLTLQHQAMQLMSAGQLDVFAGRLLP